MRLHVSQIGHPESVWRGRGELAFDEVTRPHQGGVSRGRHLELAAPTHSRETHRAHQSTHRAVGDIDAFTTQLFPDFELAVATAEALVEDALDQDLQFLVA